MKTQIDKALRAMGYRRMAEQCREPAIYGKPVGTSLFQVTLSADKVEFKNRFVDSLGKVSTWNSVEITFENLEKSFSTKVCDKHSNTWKHVCDCEADFFKLLPGTAPLNWIKYQESNTKMFPQLESYFEFLSLEEMVDV